MVKHLILGKHPGIWCLNKVWMVISIEFSTQNNVIKIKHSMSGPCNLKNVYILKFQEWVHIPSNTQLKLIEGPNCSSSECLATSNQSIEQLKLFFGNIGTLLIQKTFGMPKIILPNYSIYESLTACKNLVQQLNFFLRYY